MSTLLDIALIIAAFAFAGTFIVTTVSALVRKRKKDKLSKDGGTAADVPSDEDKSN